MQFYRMLSVLQLKIWILQKYVLNLQKMKEELKQWIKDQSSIYNEICRKIDSEKKEALTDKEKDFLRREMDFFYDEYLLADTEG